MGLHYSERKYYDDPVENAEFINYYAKYIPQYNPSYVSNVIHVKKEPTDTFYHLKKSDSAEDLKKEYYKLAKQLHPDKPTGSTKLFQKLKQIYDILMEKYA
jgi:hypothetical protein